MNGLLFYFGTDGIRGEVNSSSMTPDFILKLGKATGYWLRTKRFGDTQNTPAKAPVCLLARDTRLSGGMLEYAFCAGMHLAGVDTWHAGILPTPAVSLLMR